MSVLHFFYDVIIYPLEMIYELIYSLSMSIIPIAGVSIIVLSLFINTILIPVYKMLSIMQHEQDKKEADVEYWRKHIRNNFVGDERFFMLRTLYRQKGYNPLGSLRGSLPLLIQLPFFIAAYHFLTSLSQLNGVPFLIIKNLGKPDGIISYASFRINILPIIMTLINIVSSYIYVKKQSIVNKLSVYGLAIVFLIILYNSPSGLVLYWTLNNIFALVKNIVFSKENTINTDTVCVSGENTVLRFLVCEIAIILLLGVVIPTTVIKSSPLEFVDLSDIQNPLRFLYGSIIISAGFCLWLLFFFYISKNAREKFQLYITVFLFVGIIDSFFFGTRLGYISSNLKYINGLVFSGKELIINVLSIVLVIVVVFIMFKRFKKQLFFANFVVMIALTVFSIISIVSVENKYVHANWSETQNDNLSIPLSKDGKNVIVFMLDRAISGYIPYIMNEKPELKKQFAGFTYYPNTISFGTNTGTGSACVFGGYDYIFNSKDVKEGFSVEKRNQALKLMPELFSDKGYKVTIFDPPFANGQEVSDLSIYDDMSVRAFHAEDKFRYSYSDNDSVDRRFRNFFCYSLCKSVPLLMQYKIYDDGYYNDVTVFATTSVSSFVNENDDKSKGISYIYTFEREYAELCNLSNITEIVQGKENTFFMGYNQATHEPTILKEPEYVPEMYVDNTEYDQNHTDRFMLNGKSMHADTATQMQHYQVNMASLIQIGNWMDYLRSNDVYDNTRIIIVADHGWGLAQFDELILDDGFDVQSVNPLLMVKDFNSKEFVESNMFMTNADVPSIATNGLIDNPVNPYTNNRLTHKKDDYLIIECEGYKVKENIFNQDNWVRYDKE